MEVKNRTISYDLFNKNQVDYLKNQMSEKEYEDFILYVQWRIKETPWENPNVPIIKPDGTHKLNEKGKRCEPFLKLAITLSFTVCPVNMETFGVSMAMVVFR